MKVKRGEWKIWLKTQYSELRLWHLVPSLHGKWMGQQWKEWQTLFWGAPKSLKIVTAAMKLNDTYSLEGKDQLRQHLKSRDITLPKKVCLVKAMFCSSGHVWMWELEYKESLAVKNWCFWTVMSEKTLESPLDCKEIQPVHPQGNQSWMFIGRTDAKAETPILWPPDVKNWLIGEDPDAVRDWGQKGTTEDEMVGCVINSMDMSLSKLRDLGDGQGSLACCSPWGHKELDLTEWLNWTEESLRKRCSGARGQIDLLYWK